MNDEIQHALIDAQTVRKLGLTLTDDPERWTVAVTSGAEDLKRADAFALQDPSIVDGVLKQKLAAMRSQLEADDRDCRFVRRLNATGMNGIVWNAHRCGSRNIVMLEAIRAAFVEQFGLKLNAGNSSEFAEAIRQTDVVILPYLVDALDICVGCAPKGDTRQRQWTLEVLRLVDDDPWRTAIRKAISTDDARKLE